MKTFFRGADSTQVSDGRRAKVRKCRDCDNDVTQPRDLLCGPCRQIAYTKKVQRYTKVVRPSRAREPLEKFSGALAGLQNGWFGPGFVFAEGER